MKMSLRSRLTSVVLLFTVLAIFVAGSMAFKDGSFENLRRQGRALFQTPSSRERTDLFACQLCEPRSVCVGRVNWCLDRDRPSLSPASSPPPEDMNSLVCAYCEPRSQCVGRVNWCPDRDRPSPSPSSSPPPEDMTFVCAQCEPVEFCRAAVNWCRRENSPSPNATPPKNG